MLNILKPRLEKPFILEYLPLPNPLSLTYMYLKPKPRSFLPNTLAIACPAYDVDLRDPLIPNKPPEPKNKVLLQISQIFMIVLFELEDILTTAIKFFFLGTFDFINILAIFSF